MIMAATTRKESGPETRSTTNPRDGNRERITQVLWPDDARERLLVAALPEQRGVEVEHARQRVDPPRAHVDHAADARGALDDLGSHDVDRAGVIHLAEPLLQVRHAHGSLALALALVDVRAQPRGVGHVVAVERAPVRGLDEQAGRDLDERPLGVDVRLSGRLVEDWLARVPGGRGRVRHGASRHAGLSAAMAACSAARLSGVVAVTNASATACALAATASTCACVMVTATVLPDEA